MKVKVEKFDATGVEVLCTVPLLPEVKLGAYTNLTVEKYTEELSEEKVEKELNQARERAARFVEAGEGTEAKMGDFTTIDFTGSVDGVEFEADGSIKGLSEQIKSIQKDNDYMFNIEDSKGTGLKGAKPGEAGGEGTPSKKPEDMTYEDFCNQEG